jgi:hypothetical protein
MTRRNLVAVPGLYRGGDAVRIDAKGPKWVGLHALFEQHPALVKNYDYILLPDDDLMMAKADIGRMFDICRAYRLEAAHRGTVILATSLPCAIQ